MKKIGLVGGISWTSTLDYYKYINEGINKKLGGLESANCIINSINFADIYRDGNDWKTAFELLYKASKSLTALDVDAIVLCANTAHLYADKIQERIDVPLIHIASSTAEEIKANNLNKVALLGTKFTMKMNFFKDKLNASGIEVLIPDNDKTIEEIHRIVKDELGKGIINQDSKNKFMEISNQLINNGAEGIVLGCTEIPLLISQKDFDIPVLDTTQIHVKSILEFMVKV